MYAIVISFRWYNPYNEHTPHYLSITLWGCTKSHVDIKLHKYAPHGHIFGNLLVVNFNDSIEPFAFKVVIDNLINKCHATNYLINHDEILC